ncbi:hypothetical protein [Maribacter antarcticus]|uniref:hypothetical protein n=1 Tax=Maribacter antarcticus TaxID=505250 RepID=UPI00047D08F2|nr:hypothetical protein [Maribacter antarcticus]
MKKWNFKVKSNVQEIIKKLDATLGSVNGFVFNIDNGKNDSVTFKVRKRGLYAFYLMFINKVIVNGNILKTETENETNIEISFTQYFLWKLIIFTHIFLGFGFLIAIISKIDSNAFMYITGGILLVVGIVLWITVQNKFKKDVQEYKTLISRILKS